MRNFLTAAAIVVCSAISASAATLEFSFSIGDRALELNGATVNTGDHTMRIVVEDTAANLGSSFGDFANFYDADVFLDIDDLGLNDVLVTSSTYLYFGNGVVGFTDTVGGFSTIYTLANSNGSTADNFDFGGVDGNTAGFDLANIDVPQALSNMTFNELRTGNDIVLATGDRITGGLTLSGRSDEVELGLARTLAPVPLPASLPLMLIGFAGLGLARRRKAARG